MRGSTKGSKQSPKSLAAKKGMQKPFSHLLDQAVHACPCQDVVDEDCVAVRKDPHIHTLLVRQLQNQETVSDSGT